MPRNVVAAISFRDRTAEYYIINLGGIDPRARHCMMNGVTTKRPAMRHVEGAAESLRERGASGGDDDCIGHAIVP
jgi:hypothetical protein